MFASPSAAAVGTSRTVPDGLTRRPRGRVEPDPAVATGMTLGSLAKRGWTVVSARTLTIERDHDWTGATG